MGKAFEREIKTMENQGQKQIDTLNTLKSNNQLTIENVIPKKILNHDDEAKKYEAKKELHKIKK